MIEWALYFYGLACTVAGFLIGMYVGAAGVGMGLAALGKPDPKPTARPNE